MKQVRTLREMYHLIGIFRKSFWAVILLSQQWLMYRMLRKKSLLSKCRIGLGGRVNTVPAILYTRQIKKRRPVFIILAGNRSYSWKRRQLNALAKVLAIIGYHSLVVENKSHDGLKIDKIQDTFLEALVGSVRNHEMFDSERIILAASDFSARAVFSLMNNAEIANKIRAFMFLSPAVEIPSLVRFAYTGRVHYGNHWVYCPSSANTRLLYLYNILENHLGEEINTTTLDVFKKLLSGNKTEAFRDIRQLNSETRDLILAVYRGEMSEDHIREIVNFDSQTLNRQFSINNENLDLDTPVFIYHSILDQDIDCGQSETLFRKIVSSRGVYLHITDYYSSENYRSVLPNPARWLKGAFRLTVAFYRLLANIYSEKNYPYNPTKKALRFRT